MNVRPSDRCRLLCLLSSSLRVPKFQDQIKPDYITPFRKEKDKWGESVASDAGKVGEASAHT